MASNKAMAWRIVLAVAGLILLIAPCMTAYSDTKEELVGDGPVRLVTADGNLLGEMQTHAPAVQAAAIEDTRVLCFTREVDGRDPCARISTLFANTTIVRQAASFPSDLSSYDVVYLGYGEGDTLEAKRVQLASRVFEGGGLVVEQPNIAGKVGVYPGGFEMEVTDNAWPGWPDHWPPPVEFTSAGANHPILTGLTPDDLSGNFDTVPIRALGPAWTVLAKSVGYPHVALAAGSYGQGRITFHSGNISRSAMDQGSDRYVQQLVRWTASPAAATGPDLQVKAIEVTQAVQDLNNSVDLIAHKRTFVRVHVRSSRPVSSVTAQLGGERDGKTLYPTLVPVNSKAAINVKTDPNRSRIDDSFLFELPKAWVSAGNLRLAVRIDPADAKNDPDLSNNSESLTVEFKPTPPLRLRILAVPYTKDGVTYDVADVHVSKLESWLKRAYPISSLEATRAVFIYTEPGVPNAALLNLRLKAARALDVAFSGVDKRTVYYGMVDDGGGFMRGAALGAPSTTAAGPTGTSRWAWDTDGSYGDWYGGHEIGHTRGRFDAGYCGAPADDPGAYAGGRISPTVSGSSAMFGFDIQTKAIYGPELHDVMTYCDNLWVSDRTYEGIRNYLVSIESASAMVTGTSTSSAIVVTGLVDLASNTGALDEVYLINEPAEGITPGDGDWTIVIDAFDSTLAIYPVSPQELTDVEDAMTRPAVIVAVLPVEDSMTRIELRYAGVAVDQRALSANAPAVSITLPATGATVSGGLAVGWTANDPDDDDLTFAVMYSADGMNTWETLAMGIEDEALDLANVLLAGGSQSYLRVIGSDGFLTGTDVVGPFTMALHAPEATISSPAPEVVYWPVQLVSLYGTAYDLEDGALTGEALRWSSSLDGDLGTGEGISTVDLSTGRHVITLRVTDSDGMVGEATREIEVITGGLEDKAVFMPIALRFFE
jgi:hypothetical protein